MLINPYINKLLLAIKSLSSAEYKKVLALVKYYEVNHLLKSDLRERLQKICGALIIGNLDIKNKFNKTFNAEDNHLCKSIKLSVPPYDNVSALTSIVEGTKRVDRFLQYKWDIKSNCHCGKCENNLSTIIDMKLDQMGGTAVRLIPIVGKVASGVRLFRHGLEYVADKGYINRKYLLRIWNSPGCKRKLKQISLSLIQSARFPVGCKQAHKIIATLTGNYGGRLSFDEQADILLLCKDDIGIELISRQLMPA